MTNPDDTHSDRSSPPDRTPISRRGFLRAAGVAGLGLALGGLAGSGLSGCSSGGNPIAGPTVPGNDLAVGAEPSAYQAPAPNLAPSPEKPSVEIAADVCVVGGGAAGMCAATVAARMGAKVVLVEDSFVLGGNVTRGLVSLDRVGWGGGVMVAGWFAELIRGLAVQGDAVFPGEKTGLITPCDSDALRGRVLSLALEAGVDVRLGSKAIWAEIGVYGEPTTGAGPGTPGGTTINAVLVREQTTLTKITAPIFIDCTGDGNLGYLAGSSYWLGEREKGFIQGQTLIFCAGPVNVGQLWSYARAEGSQVEDYRIVGLRHLMQELKSTGAVDAQAQGGMLIDRNLWPNTVSISASEVYGNHLEPGGLAQIVTGLETQNRQIHAALRERVPGFENSRIVRLAERPYIREGRRLAGYYQLSAADIQKALKPDDSIARGYYPVDLHRSGDGGIVQTVYLPAGDWYGIPYRCIVAQDLDNLLMAGRCISVTHEALGSTRISPVSMALGQAAGVAGALCVRKGMRPADLPAAQVRTELHKQGALT
jgi:glycine/D-amino acid oxidase-like deaminating enzyme